MYVRVRVEDESLLFARLTLRMGGTQSVEVPGGGSEGYHVLKVSVKLSRGSGYACSTGKNRVVTCLFVPVLGS